MAEIFNVDESFDRNRFDGACCAFGVFDGVHKGHQALLSCAIEDAAKRGSASFVLTFDTDPDEAFRPNELKKLMTNEDRIQALAASGVDFVAVLPFTREFASFPPEQFLAWTFGEHAPASIHVGCGFRFGSRAKGTEETLAAWGSRNTCVVTVHKLLCLEGAPVSATRIRALLSQGAVEEAGVLLGKPWKVCGTVVSGRGEGAQMGIRTANLRIPDNLRSIGDGVYAAYVIVDGKRYKAAVNMGVAATFADRTTSNCEAHLLDFDGDIYGHEIELEFIAWLRPMRAFDDVDELIAAIMSNIEWVREHL